MFWLYCILLAVAFFVGFWTAALTADCKSRDRCYDCSRLGKPNDSYDLKT